MFNFTDLTYILNGTPISFLNCKNNLYLSLDMSNYNFKVNGIHPYLYNNNFEKEIKTITKFILVLSSMPNYLLNSPSSIITFGTQVSIMTPNNMFIVATNDGQLRLEALKGDQTLTSINLPNNSKFTLIDPLHQSNFSKPLLFNDKIVLRSNFGKYLSLSNENVPDKINNVNSNGMIILDESIWKCVKTEVPYLPDWLSKRKYLNYNMNSYLYTLKKSFNNIGTIKLESSQKNKRISSNSHINNNNEDNIYLDKNKPNLSTLSTSMQDKVLVNDILLTMLGLEGNYIKRITTHTSFQDFKVEFQVEPYLENPTCDPPLLSLTNLLLPLSFYYNSITYFLNINTNIETGLVAKNFCIAVKKIIREYVLFVNQLDSQNRYENPPLNLQNIWWLCQPCLKLLENLHKLCLKCTNVKGGALINIVYSFYIHETDNQLKKMYKFLLEKSFVPFFNMLKLWVCYGFFENEHEFQEFMICSSKDYSKDKINEYYLDLFWEMKFKLNELNVPEFLNRIANKILFIGKSLNIIRECGKIVQCPFEYEFELFNTEHENQNNNNVIFIQKNNLIEEKEENEQNIFENERLIQFEKLIDDIYIWTNETLKSIIFKEKSLESLLHSFKKFYLMECGDFYNQLLDLNNEMFFIEKKQINFEKFKNQISNALRMTSANNDINKDTFYFALSNIAISMEKEYLDKYNSILKSNEPDLEKIINELKELNSHKIGVEIDDMKIWESLVLESNINWPLNLIFSKKNINKYRILFRQLLRLKYIEKELTDAWTIQQRIKDYRLENYFKFSYFLRDNMINFIKNIIYYFFNEVIEPNYLILIKNLQNSNSMEDVMNFHEKFLDSCYIECLLDDKNTAENLNNVVQCCSIFARLINKYYNNVFLTEKDIHQKNIGNNYLGLNEFEKKRKKFEEQKEAIEKKYLNFNEMINKFKTGFEGRFKILIDHINNLNTTNNPHLTNLLTKLDYNNYYYDKFSK